MQGPNAMKPSQQICPVSFMLSSSTSNKMVGAKLGKVSALTHINFAFAFVEPGSYEIIPMTDGKTPVTLFGQTASLKSRNPNLKVFVSVGGWTFSDNGTSTQPLLGQISASGPKRRTFAANIVNFLNMHGFDGLDLDWLV